jgi:hypothetical protein
VSGDEIVGRRGDAFVGNVTMSMPVADLNMLTVHPSLPARNVKQFVELAKSRPGAAQLRIIRTRVLESHVERAPTCEQAASEPFPAFRLEKSAK